MQEMVFSTPLPRFSLLRRSNIVTNSPLTSGQRERRKQPGYEVVISVWPNYLRIRHFYSYCAHCSKSLKIKRQKNRLIAFFECWADVPCLFRVPCDTTDFRLHPRARRLPPSPEPCIFKHLLVQTYIISHRELSTGLFHFSNFHAK